MVLAESLQAGWEEWAPASLSITEIVDGTRAENAIPW